MRYETPRIKTVAIGDVLLQLGPARALLYGGDGRGSGGSMGSMGSMGSGGSSSGGSSGGSDDER